jgi:hypothetical protein
MQMGGPHTIENGNYMESKRTQHRLLNNIQKAAKGALRAILQWRNQAQESEMHTLDTSCACKPDMEEDGIMRRISMQAHWQNSMIFSYHMGTGIQINIQ